MSVSGFEWLLPSGFPKESLASWVPLLIVSVVLFGLRGFATFLSKLMRESVAEGLSQVTTSRRRLLLQPSHSFDIDEVRQTHRIPVEPRLKREARRGAWRRLRYLLVRPGSPKPAFLIDGYELRDAADFGSVRDMLRPGGLRMAIRVHGSESARHLMETLRSGDIRNPRNVVICTLRDLRYQHGRGRYFSLDGRFIKRARDTLGTVIAFTVDPLFAVHGQGTSIAISEVPPDAFFLVTDEMLSARGITGLAPFRHKSSEAPPVCGDCGEPASPAKIQSDPWRCTRRYRYVMPVLLLAVGLCLLLWAASLHPDEESGDAAARVGELAQNGEQVPLGDGNGKTPEAEGFQADVVVLIGAWVVLWWIGLSILQAQLVTYLMIELKHRSYWTATTTRCLMDGKIVRNGLRTTMCGCNRYRMRLRTRPSGSGRPAAAA